MEHGVSITHASGVHQPLSLLRSSLTIELLAVEYYGSNQPLFTPLLQIVKRARFRGPPQLLLIRAISVAPLDRPKRPSPSSGDTIDKGSRLRISAAELDPPVAYVPGYTGVSTPSFAIAGDSSCQSATKATMESSRHSNNSPGFSFGLVVDARNCVRQLRPRWCLMVSGIQTERFSLEEKSRGFRIFANRWRRVLAQAGPYGDLRRTAWRPDKSTNHLASKPMISTIQRNAPFLTPAAVLLTSGMSQVSGLELAYTYCATATLVDIAFPLEWVVLLFVLLLQLNLFARRKKKEAGTEFVILILIHYKGWTSRSDGRFMQLDSVMEDIKLLLDLLNYRHDDTNQAWYILTDFGCIYRDCSGVERLVPTAAIVTTWPLERLKHEMIRVFTPKLRTFSEAGRLHTSFAVTVKESMEMYSKFVRSRSNDTEKLLSTGVLCLPARRSRFYHYKAFPKLCYTYEPEGVPIVKPAPPSNVEPLHQLIVVTASRVHEKAVSFGGCGALTFFMAKYLKEHPNDSAISFVKHIDDEFATQPKADWRQHPQIQSRYPLNGPFRLLPTKSGLEAWSHSMLTADRHEPLLNAIIASPTCCHVYFGDEAENQQIEILRAIGKLTSGIADDYEAGTVSKLSAKPHLNIVTLSGLGVVLSSSITRHTEPPGNRRSAVRTLEMGDTDSALVLGLLPIVSSCPNISHLNISALNEVLTTALGEIDKEWVFHHLESLFITYYPAHLNAIKAVEPRLKRFEAGKMYQSSRNLVSSASVCGRWTRWSSPS
ncbi:hypothetical protein M407DRAFT_214025 [Tulasnella calospora MUT 4182]|uniref:Uncharacterized protein n=1 Tax=Tulasnella calospora MUT 4182 TaxID=1051891 RepID=A0A0C3LR48_9AGAM|nr:hypothetical protein M407DRAFT_214025 [Tulasnella calospora MUT 4182]